MYFTESIQLVKEKNERGRGGQAKPVAVSERMVFAGVQSVARSEFYQASQSGYEPSLVFVVRLSEYANETRVDYDGTVYSVLRTYRKTYKSADVVELVCAKRGVF